MTAEDFKLLDNTLQEIIITECGVLLATRESLLHFVALYQVEGFYVEVYCEHVEQKVVNTLCFSNTDLLDPYLGQIDIVRAFQ